MGTYQGQLAQKERSRGTVQRTPRLHITDVSTQLDLGSVQTRQLQLWGDGLVRAIADWQQRCARRSEGVAR